MGPIDAGSMTMLLAISSLLWALASAMAIRQGLRGRGVWAWLLGVACAGVAGERAINWFGGASQEGPGAIILGALGGAAAVGVAWLLGASRRSHEALRVSEERYRRLVEDQPDLICRFLPDCTLTYVNRGYAQYFGRTPEELVGTNFLDLLPEEARAGALEQVRGLSPEDPVKTYEHPVIVPGGATRWQQWTDRAFFDGRGRMVEVQSVGRDITEQRLAEQSLRESQRKVQTLIQNLPGVVYRCRNDENWSLEFVSDTVEPLTGYPVAEFARGAMTHADLILPEDRDRVWAQVQRALDSRAPFRLKYRIRRRDGQVRWVWEQGVGVLDAQGRAVALEGFISDITEQHQAEDELRESRERFRQIAENVEEVFFLSDAADDRFIYVSPSFERVWGVPASVLYEDTRAWQRMVHPEDAPRVRSVLEAHQRGRTGFTNEYRVIRPDGQIRWIYDRVYPVRDESDQARRIACVSADITERKRQEQELKRSEATNRALLEAVPDLIFRMSADGIYLDYHGPKDAPLILPPERFIGRPMSEVVPEDVSIPTQRAIDEALANRRLATFEYTTQRPAGQWRCWEVRVVPCGEAEVLAMARDITDRRRAEQELRHREASLAEAQRIAHLGSWEWVPESGDVFVTDETFRIFALDPEGWGGGGRVPYWAVVDRMHPEDQPRVEQALRDALDGVGAYRIDYRVLHPDGRERIVHAEGEVTRDARGEPVRMVGIVQDITETRRAEQALRESELRFAQIASAIDDVFWMVQPEPHRVLYVNDAFQRLWGIAPEQIYADPAKWLEPIHPEDKRRVAEQFSSWVRNDADDSTLTMQYRLLRPDGKIRWVQDRGTKSRDESGRVVRVVGIAQDLTQVKELEDGLRHAQKMEAVGQLASGVAHEFRNLLAAISGYTALARRTLAPDHPANFSLQRVEEASRQATGATNGLLTFAHKGTVQKQPVRMCVLVDQAGRLLRRMLPATIELEINPGCAHQSEGWVMADSTQIQQVIFNLAINARDAMPRGGRVQITCGPAGGPGGAVRLTVADSGPGMTPEVLERLFEPFFTTKPPGEGTGLGLPIVHGIVQDHGGHIDVWSEPGRGSRFTVTLPACPPPRPSAAVDIPDGDAKAVLLAEPSRHAREVIAAMLRGIGTPVIEAPDGRSLLELRRRHAGRIGLIMLDADLRDPDGIQCLRSIRDEDKHVPVVLMTANGDGPPPDGAVELRKPFKINRLRGLVEEFCGPTPATPDPGIPL